MILEEKIILTMDASNKSKPSTKKSGDEAGIPTGSQPANSLAFSSEALLQQAIANLLTRMGGVTDVQILQGTQELGKDLVFSMPGSFGETILCACVVKNTKISGNVASSAGARTILLQAEQAFDSIHTDGFGNDIRVGRVYVITPFDLPPATVASIKGRLQERAGQVSFVGGARLFTLFKQYWPDYFADEADLLEQHLRDTKNLFQEDYAWQNMSFNYYLGETNVYATKVYVQQALYRNINDYELGHVLTKTLPPPDDLDKKLSRDDIELFTENINKLRGALTFLENWGYYSKSEKSEFFTISNRFSSDLLSGWKAKSEAEGYSPKGFFLPNRAHLISLLKTLQEKRDQSLARIKEELKVLKRTLFVKKSEGIEALSNPEYIRACIMDDCAHAAPDGYFVTKKGMQVTFPKDILDKWKGALLIVGAPGYGKTSLCRWNALQDAESFSAGISSILPIYVPLHRLAAASLGSFHDTFLKTLGKSALLAESSSESDATIRLYLDGLDEIASLDRRKEIVDLVKASTVGNPKYQVILTSRDYIYNRWLDWLPRITLGGFEDDDVQELIAQWLGNNTDNNRSFCKQIGRLPTLRNLMRTPLLATLIILVFKQTGRLPENKTRLYEIFVDLLSGGWDIAKGVIRGSKYGQRVKVMILGNLAGKLQESRLREFYSKDVKAIINSTLHGLKANDIEELRQELITDGLINKSGEVMQFAHHSFQEFLAAKNLMGSPQPQRANRALESYLAGNDWWKEVLSFYIGLSTNPGDIIGWIGQQIRHIYSTNYVTVSKTQIDDLRRAVSDAFPGMPKDALAEIRHH